jgi:hypothetical protein
MRITVLQVLGGIPRRGIYDGMIPQFISDYSSRFVSLRFQ